MTSLRQTPKTFRAVVGVLGTLTAFGPLSIDMYLPAFPQIAAEFHASIATIQLSLTSFFLGLALGQVAYGPLIDRFGRKPPVYAGLALYGLASLLCALAPSSEVLIAARFLQALGACGGMVMARAVVRDLFEERDAARVFSLLMLVMGVAPILAPLIGGYISMSFGWHALFFLLAIVALICLSAVVFILPETRGANTNVKLSSVLPTYWGLLRNRRFMGFALSGGIAQSGMFAYITGSPFVYIELFKVPAEQYGWIFGSNAFGLIAASQINIRLLKRMAPEAILRLSFSILAVSGLLLAAAAIFDLGFVALLIPQFLFIATLGLTLPNTSAAALAKEGARAGSASALLGTLQFSVAALSSAAVSTFDNGTTLPMAATIAVAGVLASLVFAFIARRQGEVS